jgi:hypothetical protein
MLSPSSCESQRNRTDGGLGEVYCRYSFVDVQNEYAVPIIQYAYYGIQRTANMSPGLAWLFCRMAVMGETREDGSSQRYVRKMLIMC